MKGSENVITIYTDGAVSGNGQENAYGGWGFVCVETGLTNWGPVQNATNQRCELIGVINACKYATALLMEKDTSVFPPETVEICSDSAYIINCHKQNWYKSWQNNGWVNSKKEPVANKELWEMLVPFFENPQFSFKKVVGHSGDEYNELADKLANRGKAEAKEWRNLQNG